jgi:hypothetical protein
MLVDAGEELQPGLLDNQIATAYLTGIVAQTERFRNDKTTPKIMTMSAQLMAAGADQQLIASSLEKVVEVPVKPVVTAAPEAAHAANHDGALTIDHEETKTAPVEVAAPKTEPAVVQKTEPKPSPKPDLSKESALNLDMAVTPEAEPEETTGEIEIDEQGTLSPAEKKKLGSSGRHRLVEPLPGQGVGTFAGGPHPFTANMTTDNEDEPSSDPLTYATPEDGVLNRNEDPSPTLPPVATTQMDESVNSQALPPAFENSTLRDIEKTLDSNHIIKDPNSTINEIEEVEHSPHLQQAEVVDSARNAVDSAVNSAPYDATRPKPLQGLNATPLSSPADFTAPPLPTAPQQPVADNGSYMTDGNPPPVPPPMLPVQ